MNLLLLILALASRNIKGKTCCQSAGGLTGTGEKEGSSQEPIIVFIKDGFAKPKLVLGFCQSEPVVTARTIN